MPNVLSYTNAFPGIPMPQHGVGLATTVQSFIYPGAVQPQSTLPTVLSYTNAFPGIPFPQHGAGQATNVQSFIFPGALQPQIVVAVVLPGMAGDRIYRKQPVRWY